MYPKAKETNVCLWRKLFLCLFNSLSLSHSLYTALKKDLVLRLSSRQGIKNFDHQFMSCCQFAIFHFYAWKPTPERTRWFKNNPEYEFIRLDLEGWCSKIPMASNLDLLMSLRERELLTKRSLSSPVPIALQRRYLKLHHLDCLTLSSICLWVPWKRLSQEPTLSEKKYSWL